MRRQKCDKIYTRVKKSTQYQWVKRIGHYLEVVAEGDSVGVRVSPTAPKTPVKSSAYKIPVTTYLRADFCSQFLRVVNASGTCRVHVGYKHAAGDKIATKSFMCNEQNCRNEGMSKSVPYAMIPEPYWEAAKAALEKVSEIERDWKSGVLSAGEAMVSVSQVMATAKRQCPYIGRKKT